MKQVASKSVHEALEFLRSFSKEVPKAAFVLGSGVKLLEDLDEGTSVSFQEVFGLAPGVIGHSGSLSLGRIAGNLVAVLRGRFHLYEGYPWDVVTLPAQVLVEWGVPNLYLTNAAGGMNPKFSVGDLMLITGYRNHLSPEYVEQGLLPALKREAVDCRNALSEATLAVANRLSAQDKSFRPLQTGVYAGLLGPNYETLAEVEMLKKLKADAVGMSTVPELLACHGSKTQATAISVITNVWKPEEAIGGHEEVLEAAKEASARLDKLFRAAVVG
ncbi:MAG: purine-nucleoside phosphorylase [Candidatus Obscuribacterales bacterium]|nr:purine-nucleoside phosphorylase [Candidatus Obscuribacterales bacterium]